MSRLFSNRAIACGLLAACYCGTPAYGQYSVYDKSHGTAPYTDPELGTASPNSYGDSGGLPHYSARQQDGRYRRNHSRDFVHLPNYDASGSYRQPSAMVVLSDSKLLIATKQTGEIYRLDLESGDVELEFGPSKMQFEHLVLLDENHLLASDNAAEQIVVLQ